MTNAPPARLFRPGDGALPPALTGRGVQQGVLSRCLGDLVAGVAPPHNVVLLGPRGNGKTALLQWFRAACAERSVAVEALTPHRIASREALADTLAPRGGIARWLPRKVAFDVDALDAVVEHSQRYPCFIQLWGDELWEHHAAAGAARITTGLVAAARPAVVASVADYYQTRYRELRAEGLLDAAVAVAPLFQARADATATEPELEAALAGAGDEADRFAALAKLNRLGFVWRPPGRTPPAAWSAGIPSLMTYVLEHAARR